MFDQIKNRQGEKLYILTIANTNSIKPYTYVNTWEKCKQKFEWATAEIDDSISFSQLIHKEIDSETHTINASMRCNRKGWGDDYFKYITIEPLYTQSW